MGSSPDAESRCLALTQTMSMICLQQRHRTDGRCGRGPEESSDTPRFPVQLHVTVPVLTDLSLTDLLLWLSERVLLQTDRLSVAKQAMAETSQPMAETRSPMAKTSQLIPVAGFIGTGIRLTKDRPE